MSDDLFPGFEAHWIDTEAGRIFARVEGRRTAARAAARLPADARHVAPPGTGARGDPHRSSAWICAATAGPRRRAGDATHETYSKRAMGRDVVAVMEALGHVRFALRA